jgi:hypothetical protein
MQQLVARDAAVIGIDASAAQIESADVMYPKSSSSRPI